MVPFAGQTFQRSFDRKIIRFGAAGRENDISGLHAERIRNRLARPRLHDGSSGLFYENWRRYRTRRQDTVSSPQERADPAVWLSCSLSKLPCLALSGKRFLNRDSSVCPYLFNFYGPTFFLLQSLEKVVPPCLLSHLFRRIPTCLF